MRKTAIAVTIVLVLLAATFLAIVEATNANPYHREAKFTEVSPPAGTKAPIITIHTPQNGSFYPKNLTLTFEVTIPKTNDNKSITAVVKLYYKASWEPNEITVPQKSIGESASFSIDLSGVRGGNHSIIIYADGVGSYETKEEFDAKSYTMTYYYERFKMTSFSTVSFTKDVVSPRISVLSPQNKTYFTSDIELDYTVNEDTSQILYCLDGKENQTITRSITLTDLAKGAHNVTLYAVDLAGNNVVSKTVFFSVNLPDSFPFMPVVAISAVAGVVVATGIIVYFKRRRSEAL
jgi:hypothetical protein